MRGLWRWSTGLPALIAATAWVAFIVWADSFNPEQRTTLVSALLLGSFITQGNWRYSVFAHCVASF